MFFLKVVSVTFSIQSVYCSIAGINYMDPIIPNSKLEDPCNPLYWYPRNIPDFCYNNKTMELLPPVPPMPPKTPFPIGRPPIPPVFPIFPPPASLYPMPSPYSMPAPLPVPMYPLPPPMPLPFGIPIETTYPMLPVAGVPALPYPNIFPPYRRQQLTGMVPGLPGMVTQDGGINILPFSDAYADLLENHKRKMLIKKLEKIFANYDGSSGSKYKYKKHKRNKQYDDEY